MDKKKGMINIEKIIKLSKFSSNLREFEIQYKLDKK